MYRNTDDTCHSHVTIKVRESHNLCYTSEGYFCTLEKDLVQSSRVARDPKAKRRKNRTTF